MSEDEIRAVAERHRASLERILGYLGHGVGRLRDGRLGIRVLVAGRPAAGKIPAELEGVGIELDEAGEITAQ